MRNALAKYLLIGTLGLGGAIGFGVGIGHLAHANPPAIQATPSTSPAQNEQQDTPDAAGAKDANDSGPDVQEGPNVQEGDQNAPDTGTSSESEAPSTSTGTSTSAPAGK